MAITAFIIGAVLLILSRALGQPGALLWEIGAVVGLALVAFGALAIIPLLAVGMLTAVVLSASRDEGRALSAPERVMADWRRAGRVERIGWLVLVPFALVFLVTLDMGVALLVVGGFGAVGLIDDYLSPDGRLSTTRRRASAVMVAAAVVYAIAWLLDRAEAERWAMLLFLVMLVAIGVLTLIDLRRSRA